MRRSYCVPISDLEIVNTELILHIRFTLAVQGCINFTVSLDKIYPLKFNLYKEFVNQAALIFTKQTFNYLHGAKALLKDIIK